MQCKTCGSEWKTNARASLIIKCPFCGAELDNQEEDRLTFDNAKEALRYIIKSYGLEIMMDGLQLRSLLDEYIPDLKQERKAFLDAYEQGVCNALYMAHDEPEIDKCIAILQSIKVLTQDACMAEKWACYVVETLVYALNWNVPMFGITPNIHMYQIPENIRENGDQNSKVFIESSGDVLDGSEENNRNLPPEKSQLPETSSATPRPSVFDFFSGSPPVEDSPAEEKTDSSPDVTAESHEEEKKEEKIEPPVFDFTGESDEEEKKEQKIEPPVFDFTGESGEEEKKEQKIEPPVFDFTGESDEEEKKEEEKKPELEKPAAPPNMWGQMPQGMDPSQQAQMPWGYNPWMQMPQGMDPSQQAQMPWGYNPWMQMPQGADPSQQAQMPWGYNPWMQQQMPNTPPVQPNAQPAAQSEPQPATQPEPQPTVQTEQKADVPQDKPEPEKVEMPKSVEEVKPAVGASEEKEEPKEETFENLVVFTAADVPNSKQVTVPGNYQAIDDAAFSGRSVESISLPEGLIKIGERAFENCDKLLTVNIPSTVREIGRGAFSGCKLLKKVDLNDNIKRIRQSTFSNCESLSMITIPKSVQSFGKHAFLNCESITEIDIPDGVDELPENLFSGCRSLVRVSVPESVSEIRKNVFSWCEALTTVNIPEAVKEIDDGAFTGCASLKTVNIPQKLKSIGYGSFSKCGNLRVLILPDTLSNISPNAFNGSNRTLVVKCSPDNKYVKHYCRMNRVKCKDIEPEE